MKVREDRLRGFETPENLQTAPTSVCIFNESAWLMTPLPQNILLVLIQPLHKHEHLSRLLQHGPSESNAVDLEGAPLPVSSILFQHDVLVITLHNHSGWHF